MEDSKMEAQLGNILVAVLLKIGEIVVAIGIVGGLFKWMFGDKYDSSIMGALNRRKETVRAVVEGICKPDTEKLNGALLDIGTNRDRIEAAHAIILLHGAELRQLSEKIQALPLIRLELTHLNENFRSVDDKLEILLRRGS